MRGKCHTDVSVNLALKSVVYDLESIDGFVILNSTRILASTDFE